MNYKKNILSLVTIMALSGTVLADGAATYVKLTTDDNDAAWTLFGVNGFSDGTASSRTAVAVGFSAGYTEVKEISTTDARATDGLMADATDNDAPAGYLLAVQAIDDNGLSELKVAAEIKQTFEATEPVRSMYIKVNSSTPNVKIDYKSSMEGQPLELMINGVLTLYAVTLNHHNTYANAATAVESSQVSSTNAKLSNIEDVLDYNFQDNPIDARYYTKEKNLDTATDMVEDGYRAENAIFYHFDSISQQWRLWNSKLSGSANDFTAFEKGDAYWGLIDTNDTTPENNAGESNVTMSGLVLGSSGVQSPDHTVYQDKLQNGWNMVAIDPSKPYVRHASTGMVVTMVLANEGNITITDSTGQHDITVDIKAPNDTTQEISTLINTTIESKKLLGAIASSVNIKAFRSSATEIVLISDAKFSITDEDDKSNISTVKTLTGAEPYNNDGLNGYGENDIEDLNKTSTTTADREATSAYGEYGLIVDLLVTDLASNGGEVVRVAADLDAIDTTTGDTHSAMIRIGTSDIDYAAIALCANDDDQPTETLAITEIEKHVLFDKDSAPLDAYGRAIGIDTDGNGVNDKLILASTVPFYIKDNTFTRVFTDNNSTNNGTRAFSIVGTKTKSIKPATGEGKLATALKISAEADGAAGTGVYADYNDTKLIAVSTTLSTFDLKDTEDGDYEFFTNSSDSSPLAKGAVAGVYSLDTVAQLPVVQHKIGFSGFSVSSDFTDDNNVTIYINGDTTKDANLTAVQVDSSVESNVTAFFDNIVDKINLTASINNLHAYAYHTYSGGDTTAIDSAFIYIQGLDINSSTTMTFDSNGTGTAPDLFARDLTVADNNTTNDTEVNATSTTEFIPAAETLGASWAGLVLDLKTNAIYTPDYANDGPLYTFKDAGFDVRSILKATTKFSDMTIAWDGIDLTRNESDWFKNNEFNLFNANLHTGYWVYLQDKTDNTIEISNAKYTPTYTYYFDNKVSDKYLTTNIINGGQFSVEIKGFGGEINTAYLTVSGEEIQLKRNGISDEYTADFMKYSLASFNEGSSGPLSFSIRATDGKGAYKTAVDTLQFDYTAPELTMPTVPTPKELIFSALNPADTDIKTFHVFKEYIPELLASRQSAIADTNRLIGSYNMPTDANGTLEVNATVTANVCQGLTFGQVNNLRIVGVDGNGMIGYANVSDALQFEYGVMLKGSHVLTHEVGDGDKSIVGDRYDATCSKIDENLTAANNTGVSLKALVSNRTVRLAYEEIAGVGSSLSSSWVTTYAINKESVIQVQSLEEYAGKPFFVEYSGKMYRSAFPLTKVESDASVDTAIDLDDSVAFSLTETGERDNSGDNATPRTTGTGNLISTINTTLAPSN